ncbi:GLPGLI family protein [Arcticibacter svalbardensis]|nr:GLPGLI family protein [Arcticibacter svalbardensis]
MKIKVILLFMFSVFAECGLHAQHARFISEGSIEFEKKINMFAQLKKNITEKNEVYMSKMYDQYVKTQPQFRTVKSTLLFSKDKSLYTPIPVTVTSQNSAFGDDPNNSQPNTIFTDFLSGLSIVQKKVFEETFIVKDSIRKITWKMTDETREIAGYQCRRANAVMLDSIYVVAFYTDEILVSGGPESFSGLPGMILGVALPHENMTWFATLVSDKTIDKTVLKAPVKGKPVNNKALNAKLNDIIERWGPQAKNMLKGFLL